MNFLGRNAIIHIFSLLKSALEEKADKQEIENIDAFEVSSSEPTDERTKIWLNPDVDEEFSLPEINDDSVSEVDTWSSQKIKNMLENAPFALKNQGTTNAGKYWMVGSDGDLTFGIPATGGGSSGTDGAYYVTPEMFGAVGDGITDDTTALQNTFNYAIKNKVNVYIPSGTYMFDTITFPLNQDGMVIKGCGKWKTKLKCINDTSQIVFNDLLRYDISEITFEGNATATAPIINLVGISNLSIFHDCIFRTNYGVLVKKSAYLSFYDCSFVVLNVEPCKYLLKVMGEYFYARNCYFEGASSSLENIGVVLADCFYVYISSSDICNFYGGTGLLINPVTNSGAQCIYIDKTTLFRSKKCIELNCSYPILNLNINIDVFDESKIDKILTLNRDDGTTGVLNGINGNIKVKGNLNESVSLIDGAFYFGENTIYLYNYSTNECKYDANTPIVPKLVSNNLCNSSLIFKGNTNEINCELTSKSPFFAHNVPNIKYSVRNGAIPSKVEVYNTYGGSFGIKATYPTNVTNPYTEMIVRFV